MRRRPQPKKYIPDRPSHHDARPLRYAFTLINTERTMLRDWCRMNLHGYRITEYAYCVLVQFVQYQDAIHFKFRWSDNTISPESAAHTHPWFAPAGMNRGIFNGFRSGEIGIIRVGSGGKSVFNRKRV
jgi:hypothetical protein